MEFVTNAADWTIRRDGSWLMFRVPQASRFVDEMTDGKDYDVTISRHREKRSMDANRYCWQLIGKLAEIQGITKEEVYRRAIKDVGIYKDFPPLDPGTAATLRHAWEQLGTGWITEQVDYAPNGNDVVIRCYYGSSRYNTKQMSRLIDYIVQDCKAVGIETETPEKLALLLEEWDEQLTKSH